MALSALWNRLGRWSSAMSRLLQPFTSAQTSCNKAPANISQQPAQHQQPLPAPSAPPAGTRTFLPPPAPLATTRGSAAPARSAVGKARAFKKPLAPAPPVRRRSQQRPARAAKPSGTPLASSSPPDTSTPMDWDTSPSFDLSLASDVEMDEDSSRRCDISLATDVDMEEENTHHCDISLATDVDMEEDTSHHCNISVTTDDPMGDDTSPRAGKSLPTASTASPSRAHHAQATRGSVVTAAKITLLHKKGLLKESLKGSTCSKGAVGTSQKDHGSSVPMPVDQAGPSGTSPQHNTSSLGLPQKMPPAHCSVPTTSKALLSTGHCKASSRKPQHPQQHAGTPLPPAHSSSSMSPQAMGLQRHGRKRKMDSGPGPVSKAKCPALGNGAQRGH